MTDTYARAPRAGTIALALTNSQTEALALALAQRENPHPGSESTERTSLLQARAPQPPRAVS